MERIFSKAIPNREIMGKAISFSDAARVLWSSNVLGSPFIVCAAFSVELFIKSLNAKTFSNESDYSEIDGVAYYSKLSSKSNLHGHSLHTLFNGLTENIKNDIRCFYNSSDHPHDFPSVDCLLHHVNSCFVDHRYSFESQNDSLNMTGLFKLSEIFRDFVFGLYQKN